MLGAVALAVTEAEVCLLEFLEAMAHGTVLAAVAGDVSQASLLAGRDGFGGAADTWRIANLPGQMSTWSKKLEGICHHGTKS